MRNRMLFSIMVVIIMLDILDGSLARKGILLLKLTAKYL